MQAVLLPPPAPCQAAQPFGNGCLLPSEKTSAPVTFAARCGRLPDRPASMWCRAPGRRHRGLSQARFARGCLWLFVFADMRQAQPVRNKCNGRWHPHCRCARQLTSQWQLYRPQTDCLSASSNTKGWAQMTSGVYDNAGRPCKLHICVPRPLSEGPGFVNSAGIRWTSKTRACCACFPGWKPSRRRSWVCLAVCQPSARRHCSSSMLPNFP